ncbi:MAG TPA: penicillin acylase family protein [Gammaproteobacteria bacterium]|nr:penicillin acylase family protein [Gammaproteobacteria bacterium]
MRRILIWLATGIGGLMLLAAITAYAVLHASAPQLEGKVKMAGLSASVTVTRDQLGVPTISANNRVDAVRVLGFLHAQDRFFQMDLMRRLASGDLAALVGPAALKVDERHRLFRLRAVAHQVMAQATPEQLKYIDAYTAGVNAGLQALRVRPFEYLLLRPRPRDWQPEDSVLVIFAMYFDLQDAYDRRESNLALMRETLPGPLFEFLDAPGTQWDAPLTGRAFTTPPIPSDKQVNIRSWPAADFADINHEHFTEPEVTGSNSFAVDAAHSANGHAILANDMHLGLAVPNIWYRAQLNYPDPVHPGQNISITGVTLPGVPVIVVGSNGHVAWGFTNSYGDWVDLVMLHTKSDDPNYYLTSSGWHAFTHHQEIIKVAGHKDVIMDVRDTIWGPVEGEDHNGVLRAVHWMAADPYATNLELGDMDSVQNVQQAMAVANRSGIPEQNFLVADSAGNIAWTIAGKIPVRTGYDPEFPAYWDKAGVGWTSWLAPGQYPRIVNPTDGRLWTANARTVDGVMLKQIGDGGYDLGARAQQLHDDLRAQDKFSPADMLVIELDDRAVFLSRWRSLLLRLLTQENTKNNVQRAEFLHYVQNWGGKAATDSVGYRLVRDFRSRVDQAVFGALTAPCKKIDPDFDYTVLTQREGPLWAMVTQQPANLLDPKYKTWDELMLAAVDQVDQTLWVPGSGFATRTWGMRNTVRIRQPMSRGLPILSRWLDMPAVQLPGDSNMPRVQGVNFGASERLDVEPGHEQNGIFEMPAGQSAYPFSPFYRNSEPAWEHGLATPFLPGPVRDTLVFQPSN